MSVERVNLKFLFRLGKTPTEALKSMVMTWSIYEFVVLSGTGGSKREERRWKMITGMGEQNA